MCNGQHQRSYSCFQESCIQRWVQTSNYIIDTRWNTSCNLKDGSLIIFHKCYSINCSLTSTISNGTVLLFTVPAIAVRLEAKAWQDRNTAMHSGAKPVASSTHLKHLYRSIIQNLVRTISAAKF